MNKSTTSVISFLNITTEEQEQLRLQLIAQTKVVLTIMASEPDNQHLLDELQDNIAQIVLLNIPRKPGHVPAGIFNRVTH